MKRGTQTALERELKRARERYQTNDNLLKSFGEMAGRFVIAFNRHTEGATTAANIYEKGLIVAALAIRLIEEGDRAHAYGRRGYGEWPDLENARDFFAGLDLVPRRGPKPNP